MRLPKLALLLAAVFALCGAAPVLAADDVWRALASGGHVALVRHANAPGTGDPADFRLGDCATQRNLDDTGRAQARGIGARFRANGISTAQVYTSEWCRTRETAELLELGRVEALPYLNSFFRRGDERAQTRAMRDWLSKRELSGPIVLVTHQVNITALTGIYPASGEMVVARRTAKGALKRDRTSAYRLSDADLAPFRAQRSLLAGVAPGLRLLRGKSRDVWLSFIGIPLTRKVQWHRSAASSRSGSSD